MQQTVFASAADVELMSQNIQYVPILQLQRVSYQIWCVSEVN